ncbi:MAG TPA: entericidin [Oxalobacteraceae bacterium]|jgi:predicted small secreted protein|nr:entericidin [Oxalobacteraceae bacterium]HCN88812.1 entericidin [Oxalobacteraceae bacterium]
MKRITAWVLLLSSGLLFAGCNTMHGLGKDVEKLGEKVQQKSGK